MPVKGNVYAGGVFTARLNSVTSTSDTEYAGLVNTVSHEFGHTMGLFHSSELDCSAVSSPGDDQVGPSWDGWYVNQANCWPVEYGDMSTIMGGGTAGAFTLSLNSLQRVYLGVPGPGDGPEVIDSPVSSAIVTVARSDVASSGVANGLVVESSGAMVGVDYRAPASNGPGGPGVYVTLSRNTGAGFYTDLVTPVGFGQVVAGSPPGSLGVVLQSGPTDAALQPGEAYTTADGRVRVGVVSVDGTTAQLAVSVYVVGVPGGVTIRRLGSTLTADVISPVGPVTSAYQWFRDGQAVGGATGQSFTVMPPDDNAVYRVEVALTVPGSEAMTYMSRGILANEDRLSVSGMTMTLRFVDGSGEPIDCAGHTVSVSVATVFGQMVSSSQRVGLAATGTLGTCTGELSLPVTGSFVVTVASPTGLSPYYWQPLSAPVTVVATGATVGLSVGFGDFGSAGNSSTLGEPILYTGVGMPGLPVTVSVTDASGDPAVGVTVDLSTSLPGVEFTPTQPVTDPNGLAYATLGWNLMAAPPAQEHEATVTATIPGQSVATSVLVAAGAQGRLVGWFDAPTTVEANGTDTVTVHIRAWDENSVLLVKRPDLVSLSWVAATNGVASIDPVQWDPSIQGYSATIHSTRATVGQVEIDLASENGGVGATLILFPSVMFSAGTLATLMTSPVFSYAAAGDGECDSTTPSMQVVQITPMDAKGNAVSLVGYGGGMVFSVPSGSPVSFLANPIVTTPVRTGQYSALQYMIPVTSSEPGYFPITATTLDGSMSTTVGATFIDGPIDPTASHVSIDAGPRWADGTDAYTVTADLMTTCHLPLTQLGGIKGAWLEGDLTDDATGQAAIGATISDFTSDQAIPGRYQATVTSTVPVTYDLTMLYGSGYDLTASTFLTSTTTVTSVPIRLEFVPVVVAVPVVGLANASIVSGTVAAGLGQTLPIRVVVTYPAVAGTSQVSVDVIGGVWSVPTPGDAVDGLFTVVGVDASGRQSATATGSLDVTAPSVPVVGSVTTTSVSGTLPGLVDPGTTVVASWPDGSSSAPVAVTGGAWSVVVPSGMMGCQVTVVAIDQAGNQSATAWPSVGLCTAKPQTLSFDQSNVSKVFGDAAFINMLTQAGEGDLSYTSSDSSVVSIDTSGFVRVVGVGQAMVSVVAAGVPGLWLEGSASYLVTVQPQSLASASVTVMDSVAFTGTALTPTVTVAIGGMTLAAPTDYTLSFSHNTDAGQATVTVTGSGNYTGTATQVFTIMPRAVSLTVDLIGDQTATGQALTPPLVVRDGFNVLVLGTDFTVTYRSNIDPGIATVTVTGAGNYAGSTGTATFTITPAQQTAQPQTLSFDQSAMTVAYGDAPFTNGLTQVGEGTLSYASSDMSVAIVDATGQVTVLGAGTTMVSVVADGVPGVWLAASSSYVLTVARADLTTATLSISGMLSFTGSALTPPVTVTLGGKTLTLPNDFTLAYRDNTNAGQASVTVMGVGDYTGTASQAFTISPRIVTLMIDPIPDQPATGQPVAPPVVVRDSGSVLALTSDYTVSYAGNTAPGTALVTITGAGNYAGSTGSASFMITAAQPQTLTFDQTALVKTIVDLPFANRLVQVGAGIVTFHSSEPAVATVTNEGLVTIIGVGQTTITATARAVPGAWLETTASYTLTVNSWGVSLTPAGNITLPDVAYGYDAITSVAINVSNTGNQPTGDLSVTMQGADASSFMTSTTTVSSLPVGGHVGFTVSPVTGLTAGDHMATVSVDGGHGIAANVTLTMTVHKTDQTLTVADVIVMVGDGDVTLTGRAHSTAGTSSGPVTYTVVDHGTTGATLNGDILSYQSAGSATIRAAVAGDANHNSAATTFQLLVTAQPDPLKFTGSPTFNLPPSTIGAPITQVNVAGGVTGGTRPYQFTATGLPIGITLDHTGILTGAPTAASPAGTATITVTDASSNRQSITISYGTITVSAASAHMTVTATSVTVGGTIDATVTVTDTNGNPVGAGTQVTFTVSGQATMTVPGNTSKTTIQTATSTNGQAKATITDTKTETIYLSATLDGNPAAVQESALVTFMAGCVPGADPGCAYDPSVDNEHRTQVIVAVDSQQASGGIDIATVRVFDLYGNPANRPVSTVTGNNSLRIVDLKTTGIGTTTINYTTTATSTGSADAHVYIVGWELAFAPQPGSALAGNPAAISAKSSPITMRFVGETSVAIPVIQQPIDGSSLADGLVSVSGTGELGSIVTIKVDGQPALNDIGSPVVTIVGADGQWIVTVSVGIGAHTISTFQTTPAGETSLDSATVTVTITATNSEATTGVATGGMIQPDFPWVGLAVILSVLSGLILVRQRTLHEPSMKTATSTRVPASKCG